MFNIPVLSNMVQLPPSIQMSYLPAWGIMHASVNLGIGSKSYVVKRVVEHVTRDVAKEKGGDLRRRRELTRNERDLDVNVSKQLEYNVITVVSREKSIGLFASRKH